MAFLGTCLLSSPAQAEDSAPPACEEPECQSDGHDSLDESTDHDHDHADHDHEDADHEDADHAHGSAGHAHRFEIGLAPGLAYIPNDDAFALGLHLHLVATLGETRWGVGAGAERLFDAHGHTTLSAVVQFRIFDPWSVIVAPGVTIPDGNASNVEPSIHFETAYEFMFKHFHIGPSFEVAIDPEETHLTIGIHFGVGF